MPAIALQLIAMLGGMLAERGGSIALRKLLGTGVNSATKAIASKVAQGAATSAAGRTIDSGLGSVASKLPNFIGSRLNTGTAASNLTELGGLMGKGAMFMGGSMATDALLSPSSDKVIDGWEAYQGQPNPVTLGNAMAMPAIQQQASNDHMMRAIQEYVAGQREAQNMGGLY